MQFMSVLRLLYKLRTLELKMFRGLLVFISFIALFLFLSIPVRAELAVGGAWMPFQNNNLKIRVEKEILTEKLSSFISVFKGISDLSNKESSRAKEMKKILDQIKIKSITTNNEMKIFGTSNFVNRNYRIQVPNLGDHRICMSASILSLLTGVKTKIKNFETVKTSSPSFLNLIKYIGGQFEIKKIL